MEIKVRWSSTNETLLVVQRAPVNAIPMREYDEQMGENRNTNPSSYFEICSLSFYSLPNDNILDWSKLKALADDKINLNKNSKLVLGREENIVGKRENAGYQHFLLFPQCFQKAACFMVVKSPDCVVKS